MGKWWNLHQSIKLRLKFLWNNLEIFFDLISFMTSCIWVEPLSRAEWKSCVAQFGVLKIMPMDKISNRRLTFYTIMWPISMTILRIPMSIQWWRPRDKDAMFFFYRMSGHVPDFTETKWEKLWQGHKRNCSVIIRYFSDNNTQVCCDNSIWMLMNIKQMCSSFK